MPRGDRRGPLGMGPMTGRGMGHCTGSDVPGYMNPGYCGGGRGCRPGLGYGGGYGHGRGYRRFDGHPAGFVPDHPPMHRYPNKVDERAIMEDQVKFLEEELEIARKQLSEIDKAAD